MLTLRCDRLSIPLWLLGTALLMTSARAQSPDPSPTPAPTAATNADVVILVKGNGHAIESAEAFLESDNGYQDSLHTDEHGRARFSEVPVGDVAIQVTAAGWKTFGGQRQVHAGTNNVTVTLERLADPTPEPTREPPDH